MASQLAKESKVEIEKEGVCVCVSVCVREREGQGESSNGARKIPGNFCKFCEPLAKIRARFSEKKILPKKAHWAATWRKNVPPSSTHL